jgi:hypothetical protein
MNKDAQTAQEINNEYTTIPSRGNVTPGNLQKWRRDTKLTLAAL